MLNANDDNDVNDTPTRVNVTPKYIPPLLTKNHLNRIEDDEWLQTELAIHGCFRVEEI